MEAAVCVCAVEPVWRPEESVLSSHSIHPRVELRLSGLVARTFTRWATLLIPCLAFLMKSLGCETGLGFLPDPGASWQHFTTTTLPPLSNDAMR